MRAAAGLAVDRSGQQIVHTLELADSFWRRLRGLLFRKSLPLGHGLLLVPCASVHTLMMSFSIDLVMIDKRGEVTAVRPGVKPWRVVPAAPQTHAVLELPEGGAKELQKGDRLLIKVREANRAVPPALLFLSRA